MQAQATCFHLRAHWLGCFQEEEEKYMRGFSASLASLLVSFPSHMPGWNETQTPWERRRKIATAGNSTADRRWLKWHTQGVHVYLSVAKKLARCSEDQKAAGCSLSFKRMKAESPALHPRGSAGSVHAVLQNTRHGDLVLLGQCSF